MIKPVRISWWCWIEKGNRIAIRITEKTQIQDTNFYRGDHFKLCKGILPKLIIEEVTINLRTIESELTQEEMEIFSVMDFEMIEKI